LENNYGHQILQHIQSYIASTLQYALPDNLNSELRSELAETLNYSWHAISLLAQSL